MKKLIVMVGAPGSGKSTFAKRYLKENDEYVSRDLIRFSMLNDNEEYFAHESRVWNDYITEIVEGIADNNIKRVFADATHLNEGSRRKLLNALRSEIDMSNVEIDAIWMKTTLDTCIERNNRRDGRKLVPEKDLRSMHKSQTIPTKSEGFSKVLIVYEDGTTQLVDYNKE